MTSQTLSVDRPNAPVYSTVDQINWHLATYPLGAHWSEDSVTFAVYSKNATRILLEIYERATGEDAIYECWMAKNPEDNIWRANLAGLKHGCFYAFRCWGPNWPYEEGWQKGNSNVGFIADVDENGNRFNPNKVLYDPYARELSHDKETPFMLEAGENAGMYATGGGDYKGVVCREYDTARWVPKGIILAKDNVSYGKKPYLTPEKSVICEVHVRGLTQHPSASNLKSILANIPDFPEMEDVPEHLRGTYAGAGYMAKYFKGLGFTTVELLPVHESDNDLNSHEHPGGNYWGYMTFGYFAPDRRYAYDKSPGGPTREFKEMIKKFHDEGLEVYLDVVYNHTGEGGNWGDINVTGFLSMGGFDVSEYYQLTSEHYLVDGATGCGNQLNCSSTVSQNLVIDSLTYWLEDMGVDGFRFDLAPVLGRTPDVHDKDDWDQQKQFFSEHSLLHKIRDLGVKYRAEMIAEAWDCWGYEVGNFPSGWGEWNGRYRDAVRAFFKGDGNTHDFIERVNGDYHNFNDQGGPERSINFIVAHDGFTLMDLVSYNQKNNQNSWPFGPSDGGNDDNCSWDSNGDQALRRQRLRNFWAIQFLSRGVPMTMWGDEFGRTQNGNNNPYSIDTVATWNNYYMINTNSPNAIDTGFPGEGYHDNFGTATNPHKDRNPLFVFANYMAHLRQKHFALKQRKYGCMSLDQGNNVTYMFTKEDGVSTLNEGDRCLSLLIDGSAVKDHDFLVLINMYDQPMEFNVSCHQSKDSNGVPLNTKWLRIIDTGAWAEPEYNCWHLDQAATISDTYTVDPFSVAVLEEVESI